MITLLYQDELLRSVARRYKEQYFRDGKWYTPHGWKQTSEQNYQYLLLAKSAEDIDKIMGNTSWTTRRCSECGEEAATVALFSSVDDENAITICPNCIKRAARLLQLIK